MRLDVFLEKKGLFDSRTKAKQAIERGEVYLNGKKINKPSFEVLDESLNFEYIREKQFVSIGGYKLDKALTDFDLSVENLVAVDLGASTGGFTDCLIKNGAKKVFAVDLNENLLHKSLKDNEKVVEIIKNAKNLTVSDFNEEIDIITADLSFISETTILPVISSLLIDGKDAIVLIKPQFELLKKTHFKNGIVKDQKVRKEACKKVFDCAIENGFSPIKITNAPINKDKNVEYLIWLKKEEPKQVDFELFFKKFINN